MTMSPGCKVAEMGLGCKHLDFMCNMDKPHPSLGTSNSGCYLFKQKAKGPALYIKPERQHTVQTTSQHNGPANQSAGRPSDRMQYKIKHKRTTLVR
jgi:hypothetical protein